MYLLEMKLMRLEQRQRKTEKAANMQENEKVDIEPRNKVRRFVYVYPT